MVELAAQVVDWPLNPGEWRMAKTVTVWCVFERMPHEKCPALAAVCASPQVAEELHAPFEAPA